MIYSIHTQCSLCCLYCHHLWLLNQELWVPWHSTNVATDDSTRQVLDQTICYSQMWDYCHFNTVSYYIRFISFKSVADLGFWKGGSAIAHVVTLCQARVVEALFSFGHAKYSGGDIRLCRCCEAVNYPCEAWKTFGTWDLWDHNCWLFWHYTANIGLAIAGSGGPVPLPLYNMCGYVHWLPSL